MPVTSRDGELPAIFRRAIALALASTSCLVACGAKTQLEGTAQPEAEPGPSAPPACVRPTIPDELDATCKGKPTDSGYEFMCTGQWEIDRPSNVGVDDALSIEECTTLCAPVTKDWGECDGFCAKAPASCIVACDWITCRVEYGGYSTFSTNAGRRPPGFASALPARGDLGDFFLGCAELEAASVVAFELLGRELAAHGAPAALVGWAERAAVEEQHHTAAMLLLARRFGAHDALTPPQPARERSLFALALDNAVEGCVNETYAALVATWQAEHASDPVVRATMTDIAADETSHARFSWSLDAWLLPRLTPAERAEIACARTSALARRKPALALDGASRRKAGLPSLREAGILLSSIAEWVHGSGAFDRRRRCRPAEDRARAPCRAPCRRRAR